MATTTVNVDIQVQTKTLGQLEDRLSQINQDLKGLKVGEDAFKALKQEAAGLTKAIDKANQAAVGFTDDQKFMAADGAIKTMAGTLAGVVGVLGVIGVESEVFGEFEKKAASAIAVAIGIKDVSEGFDKLRKSTVLATIASETFGKVTKKALIATGIGAFVVALGTVVAYWDEITEYVNNLGQKSFKQLNEELELSKEKSGDIVTLLESQVSLEYAKGISTLETNKQLLEQLRLQLDITDEQIKQKQIDLAAETDERKRLSFWEALTASLKAFGNARAFALNVQKEVTTETDTEIQLQKELNGLLTDRNKIEEKYTNVQKTVNTQTEMAAGGAQKVTAITKGLATTTESLTTQLQANVGAFDENAQAQVKNIAQGRVAEAARKVAISDEEKRQEGIYASADAITTLSAVLGTESEAAKALAISTAIINTWLGVTEVLKQESTLPSPFDVITKVANVATIVGAGFNAVKNIKATPAQGGGGGGGGRYLSPGLSRLSGFEGPAVDASQVQRLIRGASPQAPNMADTPIRAYVLAEDVQSGTEARDRLNLKRNIS